MNTEVERRSYSDMLRAMDSVYLRKVLHDREMSYLYEDWPPSEYLDEESEFDFDLIVDALYSLSEAVWSHCSDYESIYTMYFSHPDMMEYYRLCRVYGKHRGVRLRDNPYMRRAAEYVRSLLYQEGCFTCDYRLQTKINHRWASGIVFRMWPEFNGNLALLVQIARVFDFYERELTQLKTELSEIEKHLSQKELKEAA